MKRLILFSACLLCSGCLWGCVVNPMPASKLFGVSNPVSSIEIPGYGKVKLATDVETHINVQKNQTGLTSVDVTFNSRASSVVDAEGNRIPNMETQRIADENRAIAQEQIRSTERVELYKTIASLAPILAQSFAKAPQSEQPGVRFNPQEFDAIRDEIRMIFPRSPGQPPPNP